MQQIFAERGLDGKTVSSLSGAAVKSMVEQELSAFMSPETVDRMFEDLEGVHRRMSAEDVAKMIYNRPAQVLVAKLKEEGVDGTKYIR